MTPKDIDQIVMLTEEGKFIFISDFSNITVEEFIKSGIQYKELWVEEQECIFFIEPPKALDELENFACIFHPCIGFYFWWSSLYGGVTEEVFQNGIEFGEKN